MFWEQVDERGQNRQRLYLGWVYSNHFGYTYLISV